MKVRVIMQNNGSGTKEFVRFENDDFDSPLMDFQVPGFDIREKVIEMDDVPGFPFNYDLQRQ